MVGFWELEWVEADNPEEAARGKLLLVDYLRDLKESHPNAWKDLVVALRASITKRVLKAIEENKDKLLPRRKTCRQCGGIIEYDDLFEHEWNIQATLEGFCGASCQEDAT